MAPFRRRGRLGGSREESVVKSCSRAWRTRQPETLRPGERGLWHLGCASWQLRDPRARRFTAFTEARASGRQLVGGARLGRGPRGHKERAQPIQDWVPDSGFCARLPKRAGLVGGRGSIIRTLNLGTIYIPFKDTSLSVTTPD